MPKSLVCAVWKINKRIDQPHDPCDRRLPVVEEGGREDGCARRVRLSPDLDAALHKKELVLQSPLWRTFAERDYTRRAHTGDQLLRAASDLCGRQISRGIRQIHMTITVHRPTHTSSCTHINPHTSTHAHVGAHAHTCIPLYMFVMQGACADSIFELA